MNDGIIKIFSASPSVRLGDADANRAECVRLARQADAEGGALIVFPELCLTSATLGDMYRQSVVTDGAKRALAQYASETAELSLVSFVGLPVSANGFLYNCVAVVSSGRVIALVPKRGADGVFASGEGAPAFVRIGESDVPVRAELVFDMRYPEGAGVSVVFADELFSPASRIGERVLSGASVIVCPDASPILAKGEADKCAVLLSESRRNGCVIAYANASFGESGTDALYSGNRYICECGSALASSDELSECELVSADADIQIVFARQRKSSVFKSADACEHLAIENRLIATVLTRAYPRLPYINEDEEGQSCSRIVKIQSRALAGRLVRSYSKKLILGISGGLDSTLALIAAVEACDLIGIGRDNVIALTLPCFGTSSRTRGNAELLCEALGVTFRTVDIRDAVRGHLADIGHDGKTPDAAFENAQARERTQVLMDVANMTGGIVVGTGDLSELALGFCTYNGDHMSMYAVNASLPKTLMRRIVGEYASSLRSSNESAYRVLNDILATPISPELLPPDEAGDIAQCTEELIGPYCLHDFFIYYFVGYGFSPRKILRIAKRAFGGEFSDGEIKATLRIFIKRFFASQFKRSCAPDGPKLTEISLSPRGEFSMPSDSVCDAWLRELDG